MNASNVVFLLLIVGSVVAMTWMHRAGQGRGGMGGCGGHGRNHGGHDESTPDRHGEEEKKPLLGPPGAGRDSSASKVADTEKHRRGC